MSGLIATYQAGADGRSVRAMVLAILGGVASIIALLCFAGAILWRDAEPALIGAGRAGADPLLDSAALAACAAARRPHRLEA